MSTVQITFVSFWAVLGWKIAVSSFFNLNEMVNCIKKVTHSDLCGSDDFYSEDAVLTVLGFSSTSAPLLIFWYFDQILTPNQQQALIGQSNNYTLFGVETTYTYT